MTVFQYIDAYCVMCNSITSHALGNSVLACQDCYTVGSGDRSAAAYQRGLKEGRIQGHREAAEVCREQDREYTLRFKRGLKTEGTRWLKDMSAAAAGCARAIEQRIKQLEENDGNVER